MNKPTFKHICLMHIQQLTNFPYIEKDFDALTDYGLLCKVVDYLNQVITNENAQNENILALYNAFTELKNYVENFFDNLDVQDEINNKLDEMVESGELEQIIEQYLNSSAIWGFDTVADLKSAENLINGSYAKTLGYYTLNDGGGATYKIREITNNDVVDNMFIIPLTNSSTLIAELCANDIINIKQLGAKSQDTTNTKYDIHDYLEAFNNFEKNNINRVKLYIPSGIYYTTPFKFETTKGITIYGDENFPNSNVSGTIISSYNSNQDYIFKFGDIGERCDNCVIKNITFSSYDIIYNNSKFNFSTQKPLGSALILINACYTQTDNLFFMYINGNAMKMSSSWECYFGLLNFRQVSSYTDGILTFDTADTTVVAGADTSANNFDKIMFEAVHGHLIESKYHSGLKNTHFGTINFETNHFVVTDEVYTSFDASDISQYDNDTAIHYAIFKGGMRIDVNNLEIMNLSRWFWTHNSNTYVYDRIIDCDVNYQSYNGGSLILMAINNIMTEGQLKDADLIYNNYYISRESGLYINNVLNRNPYDLIPNIKRGFNINIDNSLDGYQARNDRNTHNEYCCTPFYKIVHRNIGNTVTNGIIYYDTDSSNKIKLVVKPYSDSNIQHRQMGTIATSQTLLIRAKIDNGVTTNLRISDDDSNQANNFELVGTGSYKNYTIDLSSIVTIGNRISIRLGNSETGKDVYLDYFTFI